RVLGENPLLRPQTTISLRVLVLFGLLGTLYWGAFTGVALADALRLSAAVAVPFMSVSFLTLLAGALWQVRREGRDPDPLGACAALVLFFICGVGFAGTWLALFMAFFIYFTR